MTAPTLTRPQAMRLARQMRERFTVTEIVTYLNEQRVPVSSRTVARWTDPDYATAQVEIDTAKARARRRASRVYSRMSALAGAGLTHGAISKVLTLDLGYRVTENQVRYALNVGHLTRRLAKKAADPDAPPAPKRPAPKPRHEDPEVQQWIDDGVLAA